VALSAQADFLTRSFHVKRVFAQGTALAGFYTVESLPECQWGIFYIDLSNDAGRALFSMALTAKASNWEIKRVDYTVDATSATCLASNIHFE
jgi:hypothetical protein